MSAVLAVIQWAQVGGSLRFAMRSSVEVSSNAVLSNTQGLAAYNLVGTLVARMTIRLLERQFDCSSDNFVARTTIQLLKRQFGCSNENSVVSVARVQGILTLFHCPFWKGHNLASSLSQKGRWGACLHLDAPRTLFSQASSSSVKQITILPPDMCKLFYRFVRWCWRQSPIALEFTEEAELLSKSIIMC